ncbi:hypothetical protein VE04_02299 [Pseudogymnoascus sp. 24MN13]|nr:hypothetical protein VE04_02299 [Pseudogymnoascus sp. 24MN13]
MSLPASERLAPSRRQRALSAATTAQNLLWPVQLSSSHGDSSARPSPGLSARTGEPSDPIGMPASPSNAYSQREPTRSFFHSSFRGQPAPHDSQQHARDVREDTAELASYALSEQSRSMMGSSPRRSSSTHSNVGSNLDAWGDVDDDSATPHVSHGPTKPSVIEELSEPGTPMHEGQPYRSPGTSVLADMLRRASTAASPPDGDIDSGEGDTAEDTGDEEALISGQGKNSAPDGADATEHTPLLRQVSQGQSQRPNYLSGGHDLEAQPVRRNKSWPKVNKILSKQLRRGRRAARLVSSPEKWDKKVIWQKSVVEPAGYIPAVVLGALLNVLDALSYGMILFPLGEPLFEKLGPAGISMFYVSCIVSQLVFSFGGSIFKGGVGSEMIEVVPFFHKMAFTILATVGEDNPKAVISTTITSYAISSILTGLVFFLMGVCRFGYIVGFIPRHILIGCIGGVGWFLIATGLEVTARLEGNLEYNWKTLHKLIQFDTVFQWLDIPQLREDGWIFDAPDADEPWWYFYTLYDFKLVHWGAVAENIPAMFALTFFGVLHVPINIPALAFNIGEDHLDLDRELVAHGISNALSGFAGSIQNYLVYTNSVLFIKSGGNSRVAGFILAVATFGVLLAGPGLIGYIPVMMVGVLIFVLGFELVFEAVWDPRKKLKPLEYLTVIAIVLVMGTYDFVVGIFVGIALAFVSLVVQTSRVPAVRASYSGEIAGSTVRRNPIQHDYLRQVGRQIHVTKLAGYLFFGTIVDVEARIRSLIKEEAFNHRPIRYLIFDLWHVTGIDYSAAEAFNRLNRIFSQKGVTIVMSGVSSESPIGLSLRNVGLGEGGNEVTLLPDLNSALESCENGLLKALYHNKDERNAQHARSASALSRDVNARRLSTTSSHQPFPTLLGSPRGNHLVVAATKSLETEHENSTHKWQNFKEPLRLILQTFQGLTDKNEDFWFRAVPYFTRKEYAAGTTAPVASNLQTVSTSWKMGRYFESIVAGTTCGELPFFSETERTATVIAERDCVVWLMDRGQWEELQEKDKDVAQELLRITLKLTTERMSAITSYVLTTAG